MVLVFVVPRIQHENDILFVVAATVCIGGIVLGLFLYLVFQYYLM
jgi:hypothetical protein